MKRRIILAGLAGFFIFSASYAQKTPDWVKNGGSSRKYPSGLYMTGFGVSEDNSVETRKGIAESNAKAELSGQFLQTIKNEIYSAEKVSAGKATSDYRNVVTSVTQLNLRGVKTEWYDDRKKKISYALAVMEIDGAAADYKNHLNLILRELDKLLSTAADYAKNDQLQRAAETYKKTYPLFMQIGEAHTILNILNRVSPFANNKQLPSPSLSLSEVEAKIADLVSSRITTFKDAAYALSEQLKSQVPGKRRVLVVPFSYRDTDFGSQFSLRFLPYLQGELTPEFSVITEQPKRGIDSEARTTNPRFDSYIMGSYWEEGSDLVVRAVLSDLKASEIIGTASVHIPVNLLREKNIEYKPANMLELMEDTRLFLKKDVIPGELSLEVWTDKGNRNLIFKEGDETKVYVRVNKPSNLQVIYHMANGVRLLLYNNLYVDASKVNRVYTLPDEFVFAPPLGVERLQLFASSKKFPDVEVTTKTFDGEFYEEVFAEDIKKYTARMRGIKKKTGKPENTDVILTITTVK